MKLITKKQPRSDIYPIENKTGDCTPVLFDIETTGLGADSSCIYLIGSLVINKEELLFTQWFAEGPSDEKDVLCGFIESLPEKTCLVSFNGRGFDIPYLCKKCRQFGITNYLPQMPDLDLYRSFAPLKDYFSMTSRRLVAYERLIGIEREDKYNGGELIEVYKEYVGRRKFDPERASELEKLLLLHNEEDILDMVPLLSLFCFNDLRDGKFDTVNLRTVNGNSADSEKENRINSGVGCDNNEFKSNFEISDSVLEIELGLTSDFPISHTKNIALMPGIPMITISASGRSAVIRIPVINARLRHFFTDYKNYCYLPEEDCAIHKSLAASVSADHKKPATKATAYTWAKGDFIPCFSKALTPFFNFNQNDAVNFLPISALDNNNRILTYIKQLF